MFARKDDPILSRSVKPYNCQRCGHATDKMLMCDKCFEATQPKRKENGVWWELSASGQRKEDRKAERIEKKYGSRFTDIVLPTFDPDELAPGYSKRLEQFFEGEKRRHDRLEWLEKHWDRHKDVYAWRQMLQAQDSLYLWRRMMAGQIDFKKSNNNHDRFFVDADLSGLNDNKFETIFRNEWDNDDIIYLELQTTKESMKASSQEQFFTSVYDLSNEDFAVLQIRVHQLRVWRDAGNEKAYTSKHAAIALSELLRKAITAVGYRKMVERLKDRFPRDIATWVNWRYL